MCILPHTNLANLTKAASQKARSCRLCRVFTNRMDTNEAKLVSHLTD